MIDSTIEELSEVHYQVDSIEATQESPLKYLGIMKKEDISPNAPIRKSKRVPVKKRQFDGYGDDTKKDQFLVEMECDEVLFICDLCDSEFQTKPKLRHHMELYHIESKEEHFGGGSPKINCEICNKQLNSGSLAAHMKAFHSASESIKHDCNVCPAKFRNKWDLAKHTKKAHPDDGAQCSYCNKTFVNQKAQQEHERYMHEQDGDDVTCPICSRGFKRMRYLKRHLEYHGKVVELRSPETHPVPCPQCEKRFTNEAQLTKHLFIHEKKRLMKITCKFCLKVCRSEQHLENHQERHGGTFPHHCEYCNKGFALTRDLQYHMKAHKPSEAPMLPPDMSIDDLIEMTVEEIYEEPMSEEHIEQEEVLGDERVLGDEDETAEEHYIVVPKKRPPTVRVLQCDNTDSM